MVGLVDAVISLTEVMIGDECKCWPRCDVCKPELVVDEDQERMKKRGENNSAYIPPGSRWLALAGDGG